MFFMIWWMCKSGDFGVIFRLVVMVGFVDVVVMVCFVFIGVCLVCFRSLIKDFEVSCVLL